MNYILSDKFIAAGSEMCSFEEEVPAPYLRKSFCLSAEPREAALTVCALGFYDIYINGINITKGLLSPYISNPDQVMDYDVYDLTPYLSKGKNVLAFILGNGMQNSYGGYIWDFEKASFRSAPKLALWFACKTEDGGNIEFEADESFVCASSPICSDDLRQGEKYDARKEIIGWNELDFDDSGWTHAVQAVTPRGIKKVCKAKPIVKKKELHPVSIKEDSMHFYNRDELYSGYLYDFGENLSGIARLKIKGEKGQHIRMIFGELIGADGHFNVDNIRFERDVNHNLPLEIQMDEYICGGNGIEFYKPRFTYHGFRYALVCGITAEQATKDLLTYEVMNTKLDKTGGFECSDDILNKLQRMTENSITANFFHFPTDCPHREKNGWTADAALSAEACFMNYDPEDNYEEWLCHIRNAMKEDGSLPGIVPTAGWGFNWGNGPAWDQVLVTLVFLTYKFTGNIKVISDNADAMYNYCKYIASRRDEKGLIAIGLGDWCAPHGEPKSPLIFTDSVISYDISRKTSFLLDIIGKKEESNYCRNLASEFKAAVREHLIDGNTCLCSGECQTSQAMGLFYGLFNDDEYKTAYNRLIRLIEEQNCHIDCGVLGARVLFRVLSDNNDIDLAIQILKQEDAPSYGNWVARGETSLCEDFAPYSEHINSLNHHFFGDISAWFIEYIGGIRVNPEICAPDRIDIQPVFPKNTEHASAFYTVGDERVEVNWILQADKYVITLKYPKKCFGRIIFPDGTSKKAADGVYIF